MIANPKEIISNEGIWYILRIKLLVSVGLFNNLYVYNLPLSLPEFKAGFA